MTLQLLSVIGSQMTLTPLLDRSDCVPQEVNTSAGSEVAAALHVAIGSPLLMIKQRAFKDTVLVEYCTSLCTPDRYELAIVASDTSAGSTNRPPTVTHASGSTSKAKRSTLSRFTLTTRTKPSRSLASPCHG